MFSMKTVTPILGVNKWPQHCKLWKLLRHIEVHSLQLNGTTRLRCTAYNWMEQNDWGAQITTEWNNTTDVHSLQLNGTTRLRCTAYSWVEQHDWGAQHSLQLSATTLLRCTAQLTAEWNNTTEVHSSTAEWNVHVVSCMPSAVCVTPYRHMVFEFTETYRPAARSLTWNSFVSHVVSKHKTVCLETSASLQLIK